VQHLTTDLWRSKSMADFTGKSVLITGAGGGLGRALCALFAARGASLILCDVSVEAIAGFDDSAKFAFDLRDRRAVPAAALAIIDAHGVPDILINNAGWTRAETFPPITSDQIFDEIDLNLASVAAFTSSIAKAMAARGSGSIVCISSVNALLHYGNPAYAAAKAGINAFTRAIAVEYGGRGVRANAVCPGSIRTPAWDHRIARDKEIPAKLARHYPLGRIVEPEEVAEAAAFLASDRASGITGVSLAVDAGLTAGSNPFIQDILGG
jgi:NAD(P)-dependent dehydrogenase (short-subunit alcohol dehydrogenase family)